MDWLVVSWVYQDTAMHELLRRLAPEGTRVSTVQLRLAEPLWRQRFTGDAARPGIDAFFLNRYRQAQATSPDHVIDIDELTPADTGCE